MWFIQKQNMLVLELQTEGKEASVEYKESELTFGRAEFQVMVGSLGIDCCAEKQPGWAWRQETGWR